MRANFNLARLDLVSIHLLVRCAARGSLSAAAQDCHMSVMGASQRLRRLEMALGKPLFLRHRRGLAPTAAGIAALHAGQRLLVTVGELLAGVAAAPQAAAPRAENSGRRGKKPFCQEAVAPPHC